MMVFCSSASTQTPHCGYRRRFFEAVDRKIVPMDAAVPRDLERESKGDVILGSNVALLTITSLVGLCRFYTRILLLKTFRWDDALAAVSMGILLAGSSIEIVLVGYGAGSHIATLSQEQLNTYFSTADYIGSYSGAKT
ncbi:hypothetical protein F66182_864 [Fusarium sp. NRRL 66182]|nr:hypothetical protein F66182_864 [Fusarium sp. NRRL 66182]